MADLTSRNPAPVMAIQRDGKMYALDLKAHVRFRIARMVDLHYVDPWGCRAVPKALKPQHQPWFPWAAQVEAQDKLTHAYRNLVNDSMRPTKDDYMRRHTQDWSAVERDDQSMMRDWPEHSIGTAKWTKELHRRQEGMQPAPYPHRQRSLRMMDRLPEADECLEPYRPSKRDWMSE
jgi:hypothetical protein